MTSQSIRDIQMQAAQATQSGVSVTPGLSYPVLNFKLNRVRAGTGSLKALCIGDSKVWGTINGVASPAAPGGSSWPSQLSTQLTALNLPSVLGFSIAQADAANVPSTDTRWVTAAGWTSGYETYPTALYGFGGAASWLMAVGASDGTYTPGTTCDTVDVYYEGGPGYGTFKVADTAASAGGTAFNAGAQPIGVYKATITFARGNAHVIHIGSVTVASVAIVGIECYDSTAALIRVGNAGVVGCSAFQFADNLIASLIGSIATIKAYAPDLTFISLSGTIDGLYSFSPGQVINSIASIVNACQLSGDVIIMSEVPTLPITPSALGTTLTLEAQMVPLLKNYCAQQGILFIDAYSAFQPYTTMQAQGYYNFTANPLDAFHLSAQGNAALAYLALKGLVYSLSAPSLAPAAGAQVNNSSGNVANAAAVATLAAGGAGIYTYITGFEITAAGSTAGLAVNVTITGVTGGTLTFTFVFPVGVLVPATPLVVSLPAPVRASAVNTAIVVTLPAGGAGNTNAAVSAQGYQQAA